MKDLRNEVVLGEVQDTAPRTAEGRPELQVRSPGGTEEGEPRCTQKTIVLCRGRVDPPGASGPRGESDPYVGAVREERWERSLYPTKENVRWRGDE